MNVNRRQIYFSSLRQVIICAVVLLSGYTFGQSIDIKNGVNIQASYYNDGYVNIGWDLMKEYPQIEAVRIEIEPNRAHQARTWISEAHASGYQVIATYHDARQLGTDSREELMKAANWWKTNYEIFTRTGPVIINIMNEWGSHDISPRDYADAYNEAIHTIRAFNSDPLIVDVPGFGQATKIAADAYDYLEDQNIIYSIHVYTSAFNIEQKRWLSHEDLAYLDATGADCMVGEFCDTATGGADWCSIIDECYVNGWPLFGWAWNGDGNTMNMIEPHWQDQPLAHTFRPTDFMDIITDKLAGIPCYTQADEYCSNNNLKGKICDDGNDFTINDRYNEYCHCTGTFTSELNSNTSESDLIIYPNPISSNQQLSIELFRINVSGQINIINSMGVTMISEPVIRNQERIFIDTYELNTGVYWASFQDDHKVYKSKAFIVH